MAWSYHAQSMEEHDRRRSVSSWSRAADCDWLSGTAVTGLLASIVCQCESVSLKTTQHGQQQIHVAFWEARVPKQ